MSLNSKRELVEVVRSRYLKASKGEKQKILDEFTSATGNHFQGSYESHRDGSVEDLSCWKEL